MVATTHSAKILRDEANLFLGVDPGKKGGLAVLDESGAIVALTVKHATAIETYSWLRTAIEAHNIRMCAIEKPFAKSMNKGVFTYLSEYGELRMCLRLSNIPFIEVHPSKWTKLLHKDLEEGRDGFKTAKQASLATARQLWPEESWLATKRSKKPADGLFDSALIAEWCRRIYGADCKAERICSGW